MQDGNTFFSSTGDPPHESATFYAITFSRKLDVFMLGKTLPLTNERLLTTWFMSIVSSRKRDHRSKKIIK